MKPVTKTTHITPVAVNIFADLGFDPDEAKALLTAADQRISEKIAIKEFLISEISEWIEEKKLKQVDAAKILGITRPRVSDIVNKKSIKFTIDTLVDMLLRAGKHVQVTVL
jgi:predicted XRE-type DNA-binding protein